MAIGARDALEDLKIENVKIVGFDGTKAIKQKILEHDKYIIDTVDVNIKQQIHNMAGVLTKAFDDPNSLLNSNIPFVECSSYYGGER
jgi:ABC-type sugar transport system substrate-binding protein